MLQYCYCFDTYSSDTCYFTIKFSDIIMSGFCRLDFSTTLTRDFQIQLNNSALVMLQKTQFGL